MRIQKSRIRKLGINLTGIKLGASVIASFPINESTAEHLQNIGFMPGLVDGQKVLPKVLGPVSKYNACGKEIIRRDQKKETLYREIEWTYTQWHGRDRVEVTDFCYVPYERYPRDHVAPPSMELSIATGPDGCKRVISPAITYDEKSESDLILAINLMLELFGACDVLDSQLNAFLNVPIISVNWQILPQGKMPWEKLKPHIEHIINTQKPGNKPVVIHRLATITSYTPEFAAVGSGGFSGYVVFGFPSKNLFVFECNQYGNATYVFDRNWEELSAMTKAEILNNAYQRDRFVHIRDWEMKIQGLLG